METAGPLLLEQLPGAFPVFPLSGALLLPRGRLPLNIFEPRYRAMTEDALAAGRMFAMIQPDPSQPAGPNGPALYRVGCLGRLSSFSETDDGRYLVTLTGLIRFSVTTELPPLRGYRRVTADYGAFAADLEAQPEPAFDRPGLLEALQTYFPRHGLNANWEALQKLPDHDLVTTLAMACPFSAAEKQALLEAPAPNDRAATLLTLLRIDSYASAGDEDDPDVGPTRAS
jgi:Lon protease-like protein